MASWRRPRNPWSSLPARLPRKPRATAKRRRRPNPRPKATWRCQPRKPLILEPRLNPRRHPPRQRPRRHHRRNRRCLLRRYARWQRRHLARARRHPSPRRRLRPKLRQSPRTLNHRVLRLRRCPNRAWHRLDPGCTGGSNDLRTTLSATFGAPLPRWPGLCRMGELAADASHAGEPEHASGPARAGAIVFKRPDGN
jgi:hypothetical protein